MVVVLVPLSGSLLSFNRMLLASFPHAILLAGAVRSRRVMVAMLFSFSALLAILMARFATWRWVA
jgi:hypothetical protein